MVGTYLEEVREVDEHVVPRLFLPAGDVYTHGDNVHAPPATRELVLERECVQARGGHRDYV